MTCQSVFVNALSKQLKEIRLRLGNIVGLSVDSVQHFFSVCVCV
jgi:hypothetical protein